MSAIHSSRLHYPSSATRRSARAGSVARRLAIGLAVAACAVGVVTAASFRGLATVARHRLVYDALSDWIPGRVHALSIRAALPAD